MSATAAALPPRLGRDERGVTAVEFGLVAPVLLMSMFGLFDLGYNVYTASLLEGAIQKVARDSSLEGASGKTATLDAKVTKMVQTIAPQATVSFARSAYAQFSNVKQPEDFTDVDNDGVCNNGESFEDANGNGTWDSDQAAAGSGSARDAVLYQVTVTYPRQFPVMKFLGMGSTFSMQARTILRNQPWDLTIKAPKVLKCA